MNKLVGMCYRIAESSQCAPPSSVAHSGKKPTIPIKDAKHHDKNVTFQTLDEDCRFLMLCAFSRCIVSLGLALISQIIIKNKNNKKIKSSEGKVRNILWEKVKHLSQSQSQWHLLRKVSPLNWYECKPRQESWWCESVLIVLACYMKLCCLASKTTEPNRH